MANLHFHMGHIDDDPYEDDEPNNSDFNDDDIDDEDEDEKSCWACFGTGEGRNSDTTCSYCHGAGTIKKRKY